MSWPADLRTATTPWIVAVADRVGVDPAIRDAYYNQLRVQYDGPASYWVGQDTPEAQAAYVALARAILARAAATQTPLSYQTRSFLEIVAAKGDVEV